MLLALVFFVPRLAQAQAPPPLPFFKNYFVTGDYVVAGKSLWRKGVGGVATEVVSVSDVPPNADVVAAFLYVQTAEKLQWSGINHAKFDGHDLGAGDHSEAKALTPNWALAPAPCWSVDVPGGRKLITYRADVLRFLPIDNNKFLSDGVTPNPAYLKVQANGPHAVKVPDSGRDYDDDDEDRWEHSSGFGPRAIGASLVVIYRDPTKPFKAIVIYDGGYTKSALRDDGSADPGVLPGRHAQSCREDDAHRRRRCALSLGTRAVPVDEGRSAGRRDRLDESLCGGQRIPVGQSDVFVGGAVWPPAPIRQR